MSYVRYDIDEATYYPSKLSQAIKTGLDEIYENSEELKLDMGVVRFQLPAIQDSVDAVQRDQERQKNQVLVEWISSAKIGRAHV